MCAPQIALAVEKELRVHRETLGQLLRGEGSAFVYRSFAIELYDGEAGLWG